MLELSGKSETGMSVYVDYNSFKVDLDRELMNEAESFVRVGYMLKVARDTNILTDSGYKTVFEFAKAEYGLDSTMVSRYIGINDTYSVNGYSEMLEDKYKGYGYAKLSEMLTLPPAIVEELAPDMTREDIRTIKKAYQEEQQISDIEVAIERAGIIHEQQEAEKSGVIIETSDYEPADNMQRLIYDFFKDPEHAEEFSWMCSETTQSIKELYEALAPSGSRTIIGRVPGLGKLQLTIKGPEQKLAVISYRTGETEYLMWDDLASYLNKLLTGEENGRDRYKKVFDIDYPVQEKPEPVKTSDTSAAQTKVEKKPAPKAKKVEVVKPKKEEKPKEQKQSSQDSKPVEPASEVKPESIMSAPEEKTSIPVRAWHQRFRPYYEEWNNKINRCSELLYEVEEEKVGADAWEVNIKIASDYMKAAQVELDKILSLPEIE